jgi:hypothetical protein
VRSSIDCTWLVWRASREPSLSVVITQLAPSLSESTWVPVIKEPDLAKPIPVLDEALPADGPDNPSRRRRVARSSRDG